MSLLVAALVLLLGPQATGAARAAGRCGSHPWCDTALTPDQRAGLLLGALTQDEKVSLLGGDDPFGVAGGAHTHTGTSTGVPRVDLPTTYYSDGPVGPRQGQATAMPIPMALAATFDPTLARLHGSVIADEAKNKGNDVVFAPTVNIMRTPRGGRTFEAYGEDPFLNSRLTVSWIDGAQAQGVLADVKHFAANNQEGADPSGHTGDPGSPLGTGAQGSRYLQNSIVDERTLREIYLPQFEAAVKEAHVATVMCSYNQLNGPYACENHYLLQQVLRREWGFKGFVLADYGAAHNVAASMANGLDFEPWPPAAYRPEEIDAALAAGLATTAQLDEHVRAILRTLFAYGFFDRAAYRDDDAQIDKAAHARAAQRIEESAVTLLKNQGALPLDPARLKSIAVIGKAATSFVTGGGSGAVTPFAYADPLSAIKQRAGPGVDVTYADGSDPAGAAAAARAAGVAVVFANDYQTEGTDRQCLTLECPTTNGNQDALIAQVAAAQPNTVVVLETGGPDLTPWRDQVRGLLEAWYPGEQGGPAIARVLFGDADPGGRLPATFPADESQLPTAGDPEKYPGVNNQVTYKEGVLVGYRWYDARGLTPAFPFGFGLSYTHFRFGDLRVGAGPAPDSARVSFTVTNDGRRSGTAVPEVYVGLPSPGPGVPQPPRQLKGMAKLSLAAGRTQTVTVALDPRAFSYWDVQEARWSVAPGCYPVWVTASSRDLGPTTSIALGGARCGPASTRLPARRRPPACISRRAITIHVRGTGRGRRRGVTVLIDSRRVPAHLDRRGGVRVTLRGRPATVVHVRVLVAMADGRILRSVRVYRTCRPRGRRRVGPRPRRRP